MRLGGGKACAAGAHVDSASECANAAAMLGLSDITVSLASHGGISDGRRPYGCYYTILHHYYVTHPGTRSRSLNFNRNVTNKGSILTDNIAWIPICKNKGAHACIILYYYYGGLPTGRQLSLTASKGSRNRGSRDPGIEGSRCT